MPYPGIHSNMRKVNVLKWKQLYKKNSPLHNPHHYTPVARLSVVLSAYKFWIQIMDAKYYTLMMIISYQDILKKMFENYGDKIFPVEYF